MHLICVHRSRNDVKKKYSEINFYFSFLVGRFWFFCVLVDNLIFVTLNKWRMDFEQ